MKKFYFLIFLAIGISGCSVESIDSTENLLTADASAKIKAANTSTLVFLESVCAGEETLITVNFNQKTNTQGNNLPTNVKVDLMVDGEWTDIYRNNVNDVTSVSFNYTFDIAKDYTLRYSAEGGPWNPNQILTVVNCNSCEESFSYTSNENGSYTFTYIPAEDMDDAIVVFTFAQSVVASGYDWPNWNGTSSTRTETMDLDACSVYKWTVFLSGDCSGNSPNSNIWTDFKVNEVSKKNDNTPNLTQSCR